MSTQLKDAGKMATRVAYGKALVKLGQGNPEVVVLDSDLSKSTRTCDFAKAFPERFFEMGIAEQDMVATAAGLAASGKVPFVSSFAIFLTGRAWEQIRNSVAYPALNVKLAATHAGISVGEDGGSHQSVEDIALMRVIPNMTVIVPADAVETEQAVIAAAAHPGPVYLRLSRYETPIVHSRDYRFKIGQSNLLREGNDVTLVAAGTMVVRALEAADLLSGRGIEARVINMSTIKPLDSGALVRAAQETRGLVTVEEHSVLGGLGSAVAETLSPTCPAPLRMVGIADRFGQSGKPEELFSEYGLTVEAIAREALAVVHGSGV